jgi:hypothetical protein
MDCMDTREHTDPFTRLQESFIMREHHVHFHAHCLTLYLDYGKGSMRERADRKEDGERKEG